MSRFIKLRGDRVIWIVIMLLALISIAAVFSSSSALALKNDVSVYSYLFKQMGFVGIGFAALFICYIIPIGVYRKLTTAFLILSVALLLFVVFKGAVLNSAARWIKIGPITLQPSELAKIAVVLYLARVLETCRLATFKEYALRIIVPVGAVCVLSLYGSASVALIIGLISFVILVCAGVKWRYLWITLGIAIAAVALIIGAHYTSKALFDKPLFNRIDTVTARLDRFFTSEEEENLTQEEIQELNDKNYQREKAIEAIQIGGIIGRGPGNKIVTTLPHPYSDFIYASIMEEWGLVGGLAVLMLYLWFFHRCLVIARKCTKTFSTLVVFGIGVLITTQALLHICVNVGLIPVTGQTLPLVSLGGSSYIIMSGAFGIILSVNRTIEIKIEKTAELNREEDEKEDNN